MPCHFCCSDTDQDALICASCGRETTIPEALLREHADLVLKRDLLRTELERVLDRLARPASSPARDGI